MLCGVVCMMRYMRRDALCIVCVIMRVVYVVVCGVRDVLCCVVYTACYVCCVLCCARCVVFVVLWLCVWYMRCIIGCSMSGV